MYNEAILILKKMHDLGYVGYIVGGYPRDKYLGIESYDIDICTNMKIEELFKYFDVEDETLFGSCKINDIEVTTYRCDTYNDSRYPIVEYVKTLKEDLQRRDFIMNTLCIDYNGNYVDLLGARKDIDNKIINTVKNANVSFREDPLRMIRALRFKIDLNFSLSSDIINEIEKNKELINTISKKRLEKEINKCKNKEKLLEVI